MRDREPYPSTKRDFDYLARNRRKWWFCLLRAARDVIHASTPEERRKAQDDLCAAHDRLHALGLRYVDDNRTIQTPARQDELEYRRPCNPDAVRV